MRLTPTLAYYLFATLSAFAIGLHATIYVPYLLELGLSLGQDL